MKTILKWPGGKEKELPIIRKYSPIYSGRFIEPFVGGGAVFFDTNTKYSCINDKSTELINLYTCVREKNKELIKHLQLEANEFNSLGYFVDEHSTEILDLYLSKLSIDEYISNHNEFFSSFAEGYTNIFLKELKKNLTNKISRSAKLEKELSKGRQAAVFFFIREFCYSSMFRYNAKGEFNVPYGGISYNRKDFKKKIDYLFSNEMISKLANTDIHCEDFEPFINNLNLTEDDFIFLDPPYDSDFSTYAQNEFGREDQKRLCECLKRTPAKILLIIKNTDFIYNLYNNEHFNITSFDKKYIVSFMNRNDKDVEHLVITNY